MPLAPVTSAAAAAVPLTTASMTATAIRALMPPPAPVAAVVAPAPAPPAPRRPSDVRAARTVREEPRAAAPPIDESLVTRSHTFPAGWNLVSVPLGPTNPSPQAVFAGVPPPLYLYDYVGGHTLGVGEAGFRNVVPGRVFWLLARNAVTIDVSGDLVANAQYSLNLTSGWNGVATPWLSPVDWADTRVSVRNGASTLPLSQAITEGWIEGDLTDHDPASDTDIVIPPNTSPAGQLISWKGYHLFSNITGQLVFSSPPPDTDPPDVAFDPTLDGSAVTEPTPIVGSVGDENLVEWRLEVAAADGGAFTVLGQGQSPVVNGMLGVLDPTLLLNGIYVVRLTATDTAGTTSTQRGKRGRAGQPEGRALLGLVRGPRGAGGRPADPRDAHLRQPRQAPRGLRPRLAAGAFAHPPEPQRRTRASTGAARSRAVHFPQLLPRAHAGPRGHVHLPGREGLRVRAGADAVLPDPRPAPVRDGELPAAAGHAGHAGRPSAAGMRSWRKLPGVLCSSSTSAAMLFDPTPTS